MMCLCHLWMKHVNLSGCSEHETKYYKGPKRFFKKLCSFQVKLNELADISWFVVFL